MKTKIELTFTEHGVTSSVSMEGESTMTRQAIIDWFDNTALVGIGYSKKED